MMEFDDYNMYESSISFPINNNFNLEEDYNIIFSNELDDNSLIKIDPLNKSII